MCNLEEDKTALKVLWQILTKGKNYPTKILPLKSKIGGQVRYIKDKENV